MEFCMKEGKKREDMSLGLLEVLESREEVLFNFFFKFPGAMPENPNTSPPPLPKLGAKFLYRGRLYYCFRPVQVTS